MKRHILYPLLDGLVKGLAFMPLWMLHGLSDVASAVLYYAVRYRRGVVTGNLRESFPEMTPRQLRRTARRFYRNLADVAVETVKLAHIGDSQLRRRTTFDGLEAVDQAVRRGQDVACYFSHCGNWEWGTVIALWADHGETPVDYCQVYRPLKNVWADRLMLRLRGRCGTHSLPKATTLRGLLARRRQGRRTVTGFMSDQHPSHGDPGHVTTLLHHPTAMITGTETLARRMGMAVFYMDMRRLGRGRYHISLIPMSPDASQEPPSRITDAYTRLLEATIRRDPSLWLWSHRRWKHPVPNS